MDMRTDTIGSWEPMAREWGTTAYEETKIQFVELVLGSAQPRPQAFALWALSHDPSLEGEELMSFGGGCGNDHPSPDHIERAAHALGLSAKPARAPMSVPMSAPMNEPMNEPASEPTKAKKTKKSGARKASKPLSNMEKAILANFKDASKLITAYKKAQSGLEKAQQELEKAGGALRDIDRDKARLLSQFDAEAEAVLRELGVLGGGGTGDSWSR